MFDTLKINNTLLKSGFTAEQSIAITESLKESVEQGNLATKEDMHILEQKINILEERFNGKFNLIYWMMGFVIAMLLGILLKLFTT